MSADPRQLSVDELLDAETRQGAGREVPRVEPAEPVEPEDDTQ